MALYNDIARGGMSRTTVLNEATKSSSCSNPINNTRLNRFLVLAGVKLLRRFRTCWGSVLFLTPQLCVKIGERTDFSEAATMEFIQKAHFDSSSKGLLCVSAERKDVHCDGKYIRNAGCSLLGTINRKIEEQAPLPATGDD